MTTTRGLFVGRFQPFHDGHRTVAERVAEEADEVVVAVGSADASHTLHDPFTAGERVVMVADALADLEPSPHVVPVEDVDHNAVWASYVESLCPPFEVVYANNSLTRRLFEEAGYEVREPRLVDRERLQGTVIRERMVTGEPWADRVPESVAAAVRSFDGVARMRALAEDDTAAD